MNNIIYCGRKSVGKSTYIKKAHTKFVDFDKFIWKHFEDDMVRYLKEKVNTSIKEVNFRSYKRHITFIAEKLDWNKLITEANNEAAVFEMPALGMWWDLIPYDLRYKSFIFKIDCPEETRIERAKKRGCLGTLKTFDLFYRDPPIIHQTVIV